VASQDPGSQRSGDCRVGPISVAIEPARIRRISYVLFRAARLAVDARTHRSFESYRGRSTGGSLGGRRVGRSGVGARRFRPTELEPSSGLWDGLGEPRHTSVHRSSGTHVHPCICAQASTSLLEYADARGGALVARRVTSEDPPVKRFHRSSRPSEGGIVGTTALTEGVT
jgi:hypothetical protein